MVTLQVIRFLNTKVIIFDNPINGNYGLKEFKGKFIKLLDLYEVENYKLMEKKEKRTIWIVNLRWKLKLL